MVASFDFYESGKTYTIYAVVASDYAEDGSDEDNTFAKFSPCQPVAQHRQSSAVRQVHRRPDVLRGFHRGAVRLISFDSCLGGSKGASSAIWPSGWMLFAFSSCKLNGKV